MVSVFLQNFGCRVNQAEAFAWAETLQAGGLRLAEDWRAADVIIVNTCTLTGRADRDVNRFLRRALRENPSARLAITGCSAEQLPQEVLGSAQVVLALPNREKETLAAKLLTLLAEHQGDSSSGAARPHQYPGAEGLAGHHDGSCRRRSRNTEVGATVRHRERPERAWRSHCGEIEDGRLNGEELYSYRARAFVKIQDGCDNRCTFCVIPRVRGGSKSVPGDEVVARVKSLTADGFREIVLAGIHLSSYGQDLEAAPGGSENSRRQGVTLTNLLQRIEKVPGLGRLRLSSLDPRKIDRSFIAQVAGNPLICQHFHLSLQHASAQVVRRMGRLVPSEEPRFLGDSSDDGSRTAKMLAGRPTPGAPSSEVVLAAETAETGIGRVPPLYGSLLSRMRILSPEAAIGADIMVGFPGETEEDFGILEAFLERSPLSYFHVFSYSPRRGTPAASWPQVPEAVKNSRAKRLRRLSAAKNLAFRRSFLGGELDAVVISAPGIPMPLPRDIIAAPGMPGFSADSVIATALAGGDLECRADQGAELLTGNYIRVTVPSCPASRRDLVRVRITRVLPDHTEGVLA